MGNNKSSKGARFERMVCVQLSLWVSNMTRKDLFWRTAMSGGRATYFKRYKGERLIAQAGDITSVDPMGNDLTALFLLECKHWGNIKYHSICYGHKGGRSITDVWEQLHDVALEDGKLPFLIARENNRPIMCGLSERGAMMMRACAGTLEGRVDLLEPTAIFPRIDMHLYMFADILNGVEFDRVRAYLK